MTCRFADLPLFATEAQLAAALLGKRSAASWVGLAIVYERRGLPPIDPMMGGRYTPAVKAFFDRQYGLTDATIKKPDGVEDHSPWQSRQKRRA